MFKIPKNDAKYEWTQHSIDKMMYYHLSESIIKRIVRFPRRVEEGVAPKTVAVMQSQTRLKKIRGVAKKATEEIWVMYQEVNSKSKSESKLESLLQGKKRIISTWRYPGESPKGKKIPIPDEILQELEGLIN